VWVRPSRERVANKLLLFAVDAEHGLPLCQILGLDAGYVLKLRITIRVCAQSLLFARPALAQTVFA
jgi:hypothetical protein